MIKNLVINNSMKLIIENNKYDKDKLEEIKYGLESIYLVISKFIIIFIISIFLNLWKETLLFLVFFNILRAFAFGIHASKSIYCWIVSIISFLIVPYICKNFIFPNLFFIITSFICFILLFLYSPADTIKRPLINAKKRKIYKILTIVITIIYITTFFLINNNLIKNLIITSMIFQTILILPITYKIFKLPYNNYKNYI